MDAYRITAVPRWAASLYWLTRGTSSGWGFSSRPLFTIHQPRRPYMDKGKWNVRSCINNWRSFFCFILISTNLFTITRIIIHYTFQLFYSSSESWKWYIQALSTSMHTNTSSMHDKCPIHVHSFECYQWMVHHYICETKVEQCFKLLLLLSYRNIFMR